MAERAIPADTPLSATLAAAEWVVFRRWVGRAPHDDVAPLIAKLEAQLTAASEAPPPKPVEP